MATGLQYLLRHRSGFGGGAGYADDIVVDLLRAPGRLLDASRNFLGRGALFLDGRGDRRRDIADLADNVENPLDGANRVLGFLLNGGDLLRYVLGGRSSPGYGRIIKIRSKPF